MNMHIIKLIDTLRLELNNSTVKASDDEIELTANLDNNHSAIIRINNGIDKNSYDLDLILRLAGSSYLYLVSQIDGKELKIELSNVRLIVDLFIKQEYKINEEKIWGFWKRLYMIFVINGEEIGLLKTK